MPYQIWNRRYTGSKFKLSNWISELITEHCEGESFADLFAGTAIISKLLLDVYERVYINDFLASNEVIYRGFFEQSEFRFDKLYALRDYYNGLKPRELTKNYVSEMYGGKYFSYDDGLIIGYIREHINENKHINLKEKNMLLASLLYSVDKIANTVGHYDAFIKGKPIVDSFTFDLIAPYKYDNREIIITREDANSLSKKIQCDVVYIDPPYNSRQYSRFYHVLENITTWKKPELYGVAKKPSLENMSDYCTVSAPRVFRELINSLDCKYIAVSYNNTYNSKSSSSQNKISLEFILSVLENKGFVSIFEKPHAFFNAGKTNLENHKELIYITKVGN